MNKNFAHIVRYGLMMFMSCGSPLHAYRILVSNGLGVDIYAAVYRDNDEEPFRIRTSAPKLIKSGETALLGGVLPDSEQIHFKLYGASTRKALAEALIKSSAAAEPYFIFDVGTGSQSFVIAPPSPAPSAPADVVAQGAVAQDEQPTQSPDALIPDAQPAEQLAEPDVSSDQKTNDAAANEQADALQADASHDQAALHETQHDETAPIALDMSVSDHMMSSHDQSSDEYDVMLHDEPDMIRSHLLRTVHLSLASQHASRKAQTTIEEDKPMRVPPHQQRPQKHLHRARHA